MNLKELAQHLGLSQATVSRALNGFPEVSEKTRARVMAAAERYSYRPNVSARRLATGRTGAVGIVFPVERNVLDDPHFLEFLGGVSETLGMREIDIMICPTPSSRELATYERLVRDGTVDGIIIVGTFANDPRVALLQSLSFPFVTHGRCGPSDTHAFIDIDNEEAFCHATSHLVDLGHRRIALINGEASKNYAHLRLTGYRRALAERNIVPDPALEFEVPMTVDSGHDCVRTALALDCPPTALLCGSTMLAIGALHALARHQLQPGRDISVIVHDDVIPSVRAELMNPPLTATRSPIRAAGARTATILLERIAGTPAEQLQEVWPVELIIRQSSGPAPSGLMPTEPHSTPRPHPVRPG